MRRENPVALSNKDEDPGYSSIGPPDPPTPTSTAAMTSDEFGSTTWTGQQNGRMQTVPPYPINSRLYSKILNLGVHFLFLWVIFLLRVLNAQWSHPLGPGDVFFLSCAGLTWLSCIFEIVRLESYWAMEQGYIGALMHPVASHDGSKRAE
ncbi:MAG: hypothetical protein Q9222_006350 [Ikaeria aurantiellina]